MDFKNFISNIPHYKTKITCISLVLVISCTIIIKQFSKSVIDIDDGLKKLAYMEEIQINDVEQEISELEEQERLEAEAWANRTPNEKFSNAIVMGDSIATGLSGYGILDESHVQAEKGTILCSTDQTKVNAQLTKTIELQPSVVFLSYGLNDVPTAMEDYNKFITAYRNLINELRTNIPNVTIYVNGILPVQQFVIDNNSYFGYIDQYNDAIKEMCSAENITFIDNSYLVKEEYYGTDGIHMAPAYYPEWANHMAEVANL